MEKEVNWRTAVILWVGLEAAKRAVAKLVQGKMIYTMLAAFRNGRTSSLSE